MLPADVLRSAVLIVSHAYLAHRAPAVPLCLLGLEVYLVATDVTRCLLGHVDPYGVRT